MTMTEAQSTPESWAIQTKWEYKTVRYCTRSDDGTDLTSEMSLEGIKGWEVFSRKSDCRGFGIVAHAISYKRAVRVAPEWEHRREVIDIAEYEQPLDIQERLDAVGDYGWEIIDVVEAHDEIVIWMKRPRCGGRG